MKYDPKPSKGACGGAYEIRTKLTDVGTIKKPAGAPPPSSKGSISYPKPAVGGK